MRYKGRYVKTITAEDVGRYDWRLASAIGRVQRQDIGKQVFEVSRDVYQVENNEQRDNRLKTERGEQL